jgi:hypothetical protein
MDNLAQFAAEAEYAVGITLTVNGEPRLIRIPTGTPLVGVIGILAGQVLVRLSAPLSEEQVALAAKKFCGAVDAALTKLEQHFGEDKCDT